MEQGLEWDEFSGLVRSTANRFGVEGYQEWQLIADWAASLVRNGGTPLLRIYRVGFTPWYGVTVGHWPHRRDFGLGDYQGRLVVRAKTTGEFAGSWYFGLNDDRQLGANRNAQPCDEYKGLSGTDLMNAVLKDVLAGV